MVRLDKGRQPVAGLPWLVGARNAARIEADLLGQRFKDSFARHGLSI